MNPAMKQRLVGTLVLGSLALILIPLLLDGAGVERPPLSANIPPAPLIDAAPLPEPTRPEILADKLELAANDIADAASAEPSVASAPDLAGEALPAPSTDATAPASEAAANAEPAPVVGTTVEEAAVPAPAEPEPAVASASAPALDLAGLPETWTVRVGVFGNKANAERLAARLVADDYKAFIRPVGVSSGVYIGPVATRNEAAAIQQHVNAAKAKYQVDNVIVQRFDIGQE